MLLDILEEAMRKVNKSKRGALSLLIGIIAFSLLILLSRINTANAMDNREWNGSMQSSSSQIFEGILNIVWGDPHPVVGSGGETRYTLTLLDGTSVPLQLTGQDNTAAYYFGKRVVVSGRAVSNQFGKTYSQDPWAILVDTITPGQEQKEVQGTSASVFGTKKVIYLLLKFSDDSAVPHPPKFYTDLNNPDTPPGGEVFPATINGFFKKTSWNQFYWVGDVGGMGGIGAPGGWLTLPHPKSYYAPCGWSGTCANIGKLGDDGMALGRAQGITFTNYDNVNFVLSNDLDCCAWGGSYYSSVDGKSYGATWEPPWGQETGTYSHEMGHSIGLPHSGWVYYAYDSPWDMMSARASATSVYCGSYNSTNSGSSSSLYCTEPGDGYIAGHKDYLGWIPLANELVTDTSSSVTLTLEAGALPLSTATKIIKICITGSPCTGSAGHYFTVEARVQGLGTTSQFDNGIPGEGIIIHDFQMDRPPIGGKCFFNNQSGWALPIDSTPGDYDSVNCGAGGRSYPNYALYNAQWSPGQTYTNSTYGLSIQVVSRTGSTFVVSVIALPETVSAPSTPSGTSSGQTATSYSYSTGGSISSKGHSVQYFFDWGDGTNSGWLAVGQTSANKSWSSAGTYSVRAQARCVTDTSVVSSWSGTFSVVIVLPETVSTPSTPSGTSSGQTATSYSYSTGGSSSSKGHSVQYFFDWGDGTNSGWLAVGQTSANKSWSSAGTYSVRAQARCATDTSVVSSWSGTFSVVLVLPETVSTPSTPSGTSSGQTATSYSYSTGGSSSSKGHSVQYFFDWGDGTNSGWLAVGQTGANKSWSSAGTYSVRAQARCATDTSVVSSWSGTFSVVIRLANVSVTVQTSPVGRTFTVDGTPYSSTQGFSWTSGSSHTISTTSPQSGGTGTQYVWSSWNDGQGISHTVAPTTATTYTANFTKQYYLTMNVGEGGGGTVSPSSQWYNSGQGVNISANANSGHIFLSWSGSGTGSYTGTSNAAAVTMNGPITETATFSLISPTLGTVVVNATKDGSPWTGSVTYQLTGPTPQNGTSVSTTYSSQTPGSYTLTYQSGGPSGANFSGITPSASQTLASGGTITFTMNFATTIPLPPGEATLVSPSGSISTNTPTYTWNAVASSTWYYLWVNDSITSAKIGTWYTAAQAGCPSGTGTCSVTPTTALATGSATWWIQTWNSFGYGPWSSGMPFNVSIGGSPSPAATLISPSGTISTNTPTYTWNAVSNSTWYYLWVNDSATSAKIQTWYTSAQAGCPFGIGTCSVTPTTTLATGSATWWILTWNEVGYGPWSSGTPFNISTGGGAPPAATLISPSGTISTNTPTYTWNAVSNSTWYYLWVNDSATAAKIQTWYTAAQAGCGSGTGTCSVTPSTTLASGSATWWIQTWNSFDYGPWSNGMPFSVTGGAAFNALFNGTMGAMAPNWIQDSGTWSVGNGRY
jgi:hypothetical protein